MSENLREEDDARSPEKAEDGGSEWSPTGADSQRLSRVGSKNTKPELRVRSALHRLGFRFRLHRSDLPGTPDIVLPKHRTAVFVHGCYWHRHQGCRRASTPTKNAALWQAKFDRNTRRDAENERLLSELGWRVMTVWECETKNPEQLDALLTDALT